MDRSTAARVGFIGLGMMARGHVRDILDQAGSRVVAICEPSEAASAAAAAMFGERGLEVPPNDPDWRRWLATYARDLDVVIGFSRITSSPASRQAVACSKCRT